MWKRMLCALGRWWDATDPQRDVKLVAFAAVVAATLVMLFREQASDRGISANWVQAFYGLCALVGLGGPAWSAIDAWRQGRVPNNQPPAQGQGAEGQEGGTR